MVVTSDDFTMFTTKLFHGGVFLNKPEKIYEGGKINFVDYVEVEKFCKGMLEQILDKLQYKHSSVYYFHYKHPFVCLDLGLKPLVEEYHFLDVCDMVRGRSHIVEIFVEHGKTI